MAVQRPVDKSKLLELINSIHSISIHKVIDFVKEIDVVEEEKDVKNLEEKLIKIKGRITALEDPKLTDKIPYLCEECLDDLFKEKTICGTLNCGICCKKFDGSELKHYYIELDISKSDNDYNYWYHNSYEVKDYGFNSNCVALCNGCYQINETNYHFGVNKDFKNSNIREYIIGLLKIPSYIPDSQVDNYLNLYSK